MNTVSVKARLFFFLACEACVLCMHCEAGADYPPAEAIQFDALFELYGSGRTDYAVLFARYWVSSKNYSFAVVWGEPLGRSISFPVVPEGLFVQSSPDKFTMGHHYFAEYDSTFVRPIRPPKAFDSLLGDYRITDLRFADEAGLKEKIYYSDIGAVAEGASCTIELKPDPSDRGVMREAKRLDVTLRSNKLDSVKILRAEDAVMQTLDYTYDSRASPPQLRSFRAVLAEQPIKLGVPGDGLRVKLGAAEYTIKEFPYVFRKGGRNCEVQYEQLGFADRRLTLPVRVTVRNSTNHSVLQTVQFSNYRIIKLSPGGAAQGAIEFTRPSEGMKKCRMLYDKYWGEPPDKMTNSDREAAIALYKDFCSSIQPECLGKVLQNLNMRMDLAKLLWRRNDFQREFTNYLIVLMTNQLHQTACYGGCAAIEDLAHWGRYDEAFLLLKCWGDSLLESLEWKDIRSFAWIQIQKERFWTVTALLNAAAEDTKGLESGRFERAALACIAAHGLDRFLERNKQGLATSKVQLNMANRLAAATNLKETVQRELRIASLCRDRTSEFSSFQKFLQRQLDDIAASDSGRSKSAPTL